MKTIQTKYIGPSATRGPRIKAFDGAGNSKTVDYDHNSKDPHGDAVRALCTKMEWTGKLIYGEIKGGHRVYVFFSLDLMHATKGRTSAEVLEIGEDFGTFCIRRS